MPSMPQNLATIKRRIGYLVASVFVIWHTTAIVFVGPWPFENKFWRVLAPYFSTYIYSLQLGADWKFYAPDVALGSVLRYVVTSAENGRRYQFNLTEALRRSGPSYYRYTTTYLYVIDYPAFKTDFLKYLCKKHLDLSPATVDLDIFLQRRLGPEDYLRGDRPLDANYLRGRDVATFSCRPQQAS